MEAPRMGSIGMPELIILFVICGALAVAVVPWFFIRVMKFEVN